MPVEPDAPAVARGGSYFGFTERFNRYYTDPAWTPAQTVYVSPSGQGDGSSPSSPSSVAAALADIQPGTLVEFAGGTYDGCYEIDVDHSGTYDAPIVLHAPRSADGEYLVTINCCASGRQTCINLEGADYVAVDGFSLNGGRYGVRAVGLGYAANEHQVGVAVVHNAGQGQNNDPFFTGQSDWFVIENNTAFNAGAGDGHGIYLSNGSDWMIVRGNETFNNVSADFQINADPASTCQDEGIAFDDVECDAVAGSHPTGGRGASDWVLVENNFFHHGLAQGANFTSVRNSLVRNNFFGFYARHGVSFWQETDNPLLGSRNNTVLHNFFLTTRNDRQSVQFINSSTENVFKNNLLVAVSITNDVASAARMGLTMEVDDTTATANTYENNTYVSGYLSGRTPGASEQVVSTFDPAWFQAFPTGFTRDITTLKGSMTAPWRGMGPLLPDATLDRDGVTRGDPTDVGPWEIP